MYREDLENHQEPSTGVQLRTDSGVIWKTGREEREKDRGAEGTVSSCRALSTLSLTASPPSQARLWVKVLPAREP